MKYGTFYEELSFEHYLQDYSGTIRITDILLCPWVHQHVCCDKYYQLQSKVYKYLQEIAFQPVGINFLLYLFLTCGFEVLGLWQKRDKLLKQTSEARHTNKLMIFTHSSNAIFATGTRTCELMYRMSLKSDTLTITWHTVARGICPMSKRLRVIYSFWGPISTDFVRRPKCCLDSQPLQLFSFIIFILPCNYVLSAECCRMSISKFCLGILFTLNNPVHGLYKIPAQVSRRRRHLF